MPNRNGVWYRYGTAWPGMSERSRLEGIVIGNNSSMKKTYWTEQIPTFLLCMVILSAASSDSKVTTQLQR